MLEIENLSIHFETSHGVIPAVRSLSFKLQQGETLGVVGESGCGKSITNLALMGLLPPNARVQAERMSFAGHDLLTLKEKEWQALRGRHLAMIFQDPMSALNPVLPISFQIEETLQIHHPQMNKRERRLRVLELLGLVGIPSPEERLRSYPHQLSGGMGQRVMIAMAIASTPKLLIADEPTTALDVTIQSQILALLKEIQKKQGMGLILVTHDLGVVASIADQIQVMYAGEIVEKGTVGDIIKTPQHPYTQGLLNSRPGEEKAFRQKLPFIPGMVPHLGQRPPGCQFAPRCVYQLPQCSEAVPPLVEREGRLVRCPRENI